MSFSLTICLADTNTGTFLSPTVVGLTNHGAESIKEICRNFSGKPIHRDIISGMADTSVEGLPRDLRQLHGRGMEALQRHNFDYAIALFLQVLEKIPTCYDCRAALRTAQQKKSSGGGSGGFFKKMLNGASASPQLARGRLALNSNPLEALHIAEQILGSDPNSSLAHRLYTDAALAAELPKTALLSLDFLHQHSPDNIQLAVEFAETLAQTGDIARAEQIMMQICRAHPHDPMLGEKMKNISAMRTLGEGGYEQLANGQGSYRDILRDKEQAVVLEQEHRVHKAEDVTSRLIREYESRLPNEPHNLKLMRSLAELYTEKNQFDEALAYYAKVKTSEMGNDPALDRAIATTVVRKYDHIIAQLDPTNPKQSAQIANLEAEKLAYQVDECRQRVEKYPTDLFIRFEMGTLFFQVGKLTEAIAEFQKAQANPHKRIAAMNYLAQCFARRGMNDSAVRMLQNALREKQVFDDEKKELTYQLGCIYEQMGKRQEAMEQFTTIYETDIGYKDVAAKVDSFYAGQ